MNNVIIFILYFIFTCTGMVLLKLGGNETYKALFSISLINLNVSLITIMGFICYGISFVLYTILLNKYELSFLNPFTIGVTSVIILISAVLIFNEQISILKLIGIFMILLGVVLINLSK